MTNEELDKAYEALCPGTNPRAIIHRLAEEAAACYRKRNEPIPSHVQAALDATDQCRPET